MCIRAFFDVSLKANQCFEGILSVRGQMLRKIVLHHRSKLVQRRLPLSGGLIFLIIPSAVSACDHPDRSLSQTHNQLAAKAASNSMAKLLCGPPRKGASHSEVGEFTEFTVRLP
jgi:hypothetical protein